MKKLIAWVAIMAGLPIVLFSANTCKNTDQACYVTGPYSNPTTVFRIDASGNVTTNGTLAVTGTSTHTGNVTNSGTVTNTGNVTNSALTILGVQTLVAVTSFTAITPTSSFMTLSSSGGNVGMLGSGSTNVPVFSTASATNGTWLVVTSSEGFNTITLSSGTNAALDLGSATRLISYGKVLTLIYDALSSTWREIAYGNN